ncbi:hypothetical protein [Marinibacterium sp. SX1]|uniref:hypothetical protein n=1 Tax=Marinibacterium sp. SX1 TaxID=3388424 RepID=UPI003D177812
MKTTRPPPKRVHGHAIARARPTRAGALWLALVISLPAGAVLGALELGWRLLR